MISHQIFSSQWCYCTWAQHLETQNCLATGLWCAEDLLRLQGVGVCEALPASSTHKAKTGLTFSSSQRWEGRTRTCWELSAASPGPQLRALTQGCCISHPSTLGTAYGFLLKDTTEQRTCFVSLKLIFSTKGDPFSFFCFSFSGESFYHTHIPFLCWEELVSALGLLFFNLFPPCRCSFTTINM